MGSEIVYVCDIEKREPSSHGVYGDSRRNDRSSQGKSGPNPMGERDGHRLTFRTVVNCLSLE